MKNLIDFYQDVLAFANLHGDDNGYVRSNGGEKAIITVQNRFMVLPTREHLRALGTDKEVFHPLAENTLSRMSESLSTYIYRLNGCLNTRFAQTVNELKNFCGSPKKQQTLTPAQLKIIRNVQGEEDTKEDLSFERFLAQQIVKNPSGAFFNIAMGRGAMFKGAKKSRVGFVTFPLYHKIVADLEKPRKDSEFEGMPKKNLEMMLQLYEAVFPGLTVPEEYGYGFETGLAPWFTTLMQTAFGLADALNLVTEAFASEFSSEDFEPLNLKWREVLDNQDELQKLARSAPNTELAPVAEPTASPRRLFQAPEPQPAARPTVTPAVLQVPFVAGGPAPAAYNTLPAPGGFARPTTQQGRPRVPMEQWQRQSAAPSNLGAQGAVMEAIRRYNEGYTNFFMAHVQQFGIPPGNMPDPRTLLPNQPAPPYPNAPPLPIIPGVTVPPQQQQWGQPQMMQQPVYGQQPMVYGQQPMQQPMVYGQQPMVYGQQPPQTQQWGSGWGQPQQPAQPNYGNQNYNQANNTHTGTVFPGAI